MQWRQQIRNKVNNAPYQRMFCAKFGWNWPNDSKEDLEKSCEKLNADNGQKSWQNESETQVG